MTVTRHIDPSIQDGVALDEIELYGELIIAASSSERPLTSEEIDAVLGVAHVGRGGSIRIASGGGSSKR